MEDSSPKSPSATQYKVKLASGRILGPMDIERIRVLIHKSHIVGTEPARVYPDGEWIDINLIPEIAEVLLSKAQGELTRQMELQGSGYKPISGPLPGMSGNAEPLATELLPELPEIPENEPALAAESADEEKTMVLGGTDDEKTRVATSMNEAAVLPSDEPVIELGIEPQMSPPSFSQENTVMLDRPNMPKAPQGSGGGEKKRSPRDILKAVAVVGALLMMVHEIFFVSEPSKGPQRAEPVRPRLPAYVEGKSDPQKSTKIYAAAMKQYLADNVVGYRQAAELLLESASHDITNVKALAMLASTYLNLIDSSNKDENYFSVISKLIDLSRAKAVDLPETVIADVEFFVTVNKAEAAQNRIIEYTKTHQNFGLEMFYYLAYAFYHRGDTQNAARYISQLPDKKAFSPKIFFLRGQIAEMLNDPETAVKEYEKAVKMNPEHVRSRLRIAHLLDKGGRLSEAAVHLEYIVRHSPYLPPKDLAYGFYLHARLSQLFKKWDLALGDIERSVKLDKENHDYLLELYTLRAKVGESVENVQRDARMYYFLGEGEKQLREGKYQDALIQFLEARQTNLDSSLPLLKAGDMFVYLHDLRNARLNYQKAAEKAPNSIEVWSKYIDVLIQSFEWEEAQKAMDRFRKLPVNQSAIDKAAADMYAKQGKHTEAQMFYKKAMSRSSIDPDVYIAYAKSLMATKNYADAPFFFALALRFDPLSIEAIVGTAKCIAASESIDRAITMLQDELTKSGRTRAEILTAIAEFQIQKGDWSQALLTVDQAINVNPDYAYSFKILAQIHLNRDSVDKTALDRALQAYKSYSDRNASDPSGYLERYRVFIRKAEFDKASDELARIYELYPKYPNLHFYKGALYTVMGNHKAAGEEYLEELKNNPTSVNTLIALGKEMIELGAVSDALIQFNKAMQISPQAAEPKHLSGYSNYLLKNYQGAIALYNAALALDAGNPLIYKRMGMAYRDMGDYIGASRAFRKYLEMEPDASDKAEFQKFL